MLNPIGIFDSGVGGLTVLEDLLKELPNESFEYYADSGNCPYGNKTVEEIIKNSSIIMDYLTNKNCKIIIVACNTITTNIIDILRNKYKLPIIGIEPGTKPAYNNSTNKRIGILATEGTIKGQLYNQTLKNFSNNAFFISQAGKGLVDLIENDLIDSLVMRDKLMTLLKPMIDKDIDTLVLGCTHYNYLTPLLSKLLPHSIEIVNTTRAVTRQIIRILNDNELVSTDSQRYVNVATTGSLEMLNKFIKRLNINDSNLKIGKVPV